MKKIEKNSSMLKYGGYASVMTAVVIVLVIVVNLIVSQFNIKIDLTKNKLYTLSEDTIALVQSLESDITLYSVYAENAELTVVTEILAKYASLSKHIKAETVDPYKNPQFATKYSEGGDTVAIGSVVIDAGDTYKVIPQESLADVVTNQATGETYMQGIKLESVLTGAIRGITSGETSSIYTLTGHGEFEIYPELIKEMEYGGYTLNQLNLITTQTMPEDASMLIINAPTTDITKNELDIITTYLDNGGDLLVTLGVTIAEMPNFDTLLAHYGVAGGKNMVLEGDPDNIYQQTPFYIIPVLSSESAITQKMVTNKTNAFAPYSSSIERLQNIRSTVKIQPFMATSEASYAKPMTSLDKLEMSEGDERGPFVLGLTITDVDKTGKEDEVKIVVLGSETVMESGINEVVNGGNYGLVMNAVDWLTDNETALRSKSLGAESYLQISQSKAIVVMFVCVILIPAIIIALGLTVVLRRKNR